MEYDFSPEALERCYLSGDENKIRAFTSGLRKVFLKRHNEAADRPLPERVAIGIRDATGIGEFALPIIFSEVNGERIGFAAVSNLSVPLDEAHPLTTVGAKLHDPEVMDLTTNFLSGYEFLEGPFDPPSNPLEEPSYPSLEARGRVYWVARHYRDLLGLWTAHAAMNTILDTIEAEGGEILSLMQSPLPEFQFRNSKGEVKETTNCIAALSLRPPFRDDPIRYWIFMNDVVRQLRIQVLPHFDSIPKRSFPAPEMSEPPPITPARLPRIECSLQELKERREVWDAFASFAARLSDAREKVKWALSVAPANWHDQDRAQLAGVHPKTFSKHK